MTATTDDAPHSGHTCVGLTVFVFADRPAIGIYRSQLVGNFTNG